VIRVTHDIRGADYKAVVARACERYTSFSLVWRDEFTFAPSALDIQRELQPFQITREHTDQWPGTELLGHKALVIRYSTRACSTGVLERAKSLFGWLPTELPEDIAFYRADDSCAIVTISHEQDAIFYDDDWMQLLPASAKPEVEEAKNT
jgi:hypothetical protein